MLEKNSQTIRSKVIPSKKFLLSNEQEWCKNKILSIFYLNKNINPDENYEIKEQALLKKNLKKGKKILRISKKLKSSTENEAPESPLKINEEKKNLLIDLDYIEGDAPTSTNRNSISPLDRGFKFRKLSFHEEFINNFTPFEKRNSRILERKSFRSQSNLLKFVAPKRNLESDTKINFIDLTENQISKLTIKLLKKDIQSRTEDDLRILMKCTEKFLFFKNLTEKTHEKCCKIIRHCFLKKDEIVFLEGSVSKDFFIIINGCVGVYKDEYNKTGEEFKKEHKRLFKGETFGELGLIERMPRFATIICLEDCHFALIDRKNYKNILEQNEAKKFYEKLNFFSNIKFLQKFSQKQLKFLVYQATLLTFPKNHTIFKQGEKGDNLFLIFTGQIKVIKEFNLNNVNGINIIDLAKQKKKFEISILTEKESFGEECLFDDYRLYTIKTDSKVSEVLKVLQHNPKIKDYIKQEIQLKNDLRIKRFENILKVKEDINKNQIRILNQKKEPEKIYQINGEKVNLNKSLSEMLKSLSDLTKNAKKTTISTNIIKELLEKQSKTKKNNSSFSTNFYIPKKHKQQSFHTNKNSENTNTIFEYQKKELLRKNLEEQSKSLEENPSSKITLPFFENQINDCLKYMPKQNKFKRKANNFESKPILDSFDSVNDSNNFSNRRNKIFLRNNIKKANMISLNSFHMNNNNPINSKNSFENENNSNSYLKKHSEIFQNEKKNKKINSFFGFEELEYLNFLSYHFSRR